MLNCRNLFKERVSKKNMEEENGIKKEEMEKNIEVKTEDEKDSSEDKKDRLAPSGVPTSSEEGKRNEIKIDNNPDNSAVADVTDKIKQNPWIAATVILALIVAYLFFTGSSGITGNVISGDDAGVILTEHLNDLTGGGVEYISNEDIGSLYQVTVNYEGQDVPVFITKDGTYFVQGAVPITGEVIADTPTDAPTQTPPPANLIKSDKPEVELFVMTHCPYGTQAEKGFIPAIETLGDSIDSSVKFVHYFLHDPEETETPIQICIRENEPNKYNDYLKCFLEDGDSDRCLAETKIDETQLNKCIEEDYEAFYAADSVLSEGYGVRGSPTLVINGAIVQSGRDSAGYLATICSAFNDEPEECSEVLSSASPSPGFGYTATPAASNSDAQC